MSVFKENSNVNNHPNRNTFDGSFQNHLTMKMGYLYPAFCKEVVPGDTFDIQSAFGFKFMPLVFPIQSHLKATMHFFYVRNRNLMDDWENFISGLPDKNGNPIVHPYIAPTSPTSFATGSLSDYLGVPTTKPNLYETYSVHHQHYNVNVDLIENVLVDVSNNNSTDYPIQQARPAAAAGSQYSIDLADCVAAPAGQVVSRRYFVNSDRLFIYEDSPLSFNELYRIIDDGEFRFMFPDFNGRLCNLSDVYPLIGIFESSWNSFSLHANGSFTTTTNGISYFSAQHSNFLDNIVRNIGRIPDGLEFHLAFAVKDGATLTSSLRSMGDYFPSYAYLRCDEASILDDDTHYRNGDILINALPYRAYESCCRTFYSDDVLQPMLDPNTGLPNYNHWVRNTGNGADNLLYELQRRNYEADFLTTCRPSPQFGNAPLVGMTALGNMTITDENGITTAQAEIDNDGTITNVVLTSPAASINHARTAMNIATAGMSINDFRNASSLQKFLETTLRKGYKYLDFIQGHFGKAPDYKEFKLPEFIGGFVQDVDVASLTNMAQSDGMQLGEFVGQAGCFGGSKHNIHHYCDDFGFIIGILSIVPTPTYQTLLPKTFLHSKQLDYYFPEFALIPPQPVPMKEVCPVYCSDSTELESTFGYQRPNYDLVANVDECHGQFRTTLSNFLIQRYFSGLPELGDEFLRIDPKECNQIFSYNSPHEDNIIGQMVFNVKMTRPIPRITIPTIS